ncbi:MULTISPECIES: hypothetical protein [Saccharothrix]|uniref:hypothetical protein n=1 Tax=Saccharothrix TaxID=2071 RepID=UPI0027D2DEB3|nr:MULTISPECIES: hypothetical protein [Saccharothrix]MBY8849710.1 hypothetical protein [Saccharothrix sp. MB29]MDU0293535.1 hypothetical protein [Saccharothrix longispora]
MDEEELERLHRRADLLAIVHHDRMTPDQLRTAIAERERGADPHQAEAKTGRFGQADET